MTTLANMSRSERAFMARRLPRTYQAMTERARASAAAGCAELRPGDRRRARLATFNRRRHFAAVSQRLSSLPSRHRTAPAAAHYYETRCRRIRELLVAHLGMEWPQLISQHRARDLVRARHAAMYLMHKHTHLNLPEIGAMFGGRDHTTVIHARDKVAGAPAKFSDIIEPIERQLGVL